MKRYSKQDYLDALEGAGPLAWQKDLRALVRDLADEVSRLEKTLAAAEAEVERLESDLEDSLKEVEMLELDIEDIQKELDELKTE